MKKCATESDDGTRSVDRYLGEKRKRPAAVNESTEVRRSRVS